VVTERVSGLSVNERAAVDVALDALIQMRLGLPSSALGQVSESRPVQALLSKESATTELPTLDFVVDDSR
jgi:hypothetical protein